MKQGPAYKKAIDDVMDAAAEELNEHGPIATPHDAWGKLQEELNEFSAEVQKKGKDRSKANMRKELAQLAAKSIRAMAEIT